jgi:hypothetical protein
VRFFDDAFTFCEARSAGHILVYFIPGDSADTTSGRRRLNWVWYVGVNEADLPRILVDRDGRPVSCCGPAPVCPSDHSTRAEHSADDRRRATAQEGTWR